MKKLMFWGLITSLIIVVGGFIFYQFYLSSFVAELVTTPEEELSSIIPENIKTEIVKINKASSEVFEELKLSNISIDDAINAIDQVDENQVYRLLDTLNSINGVERLNLDTLFNIGKRLVDVPLDVEVFREAFKRRATPEKIRRALRYANKQRNLQLLSPARARIIAKRILREKEKEFNAVVNGQKND